MRTLGNERERRKGGISKDKRGRRKKKEKRRLRVSEGREGEGE